MAEDFPGMGKESQSPDMGDGFGVFQMDDAAMAGQNHIIAVEGGDLMGEVAVPGTIGFCLVKEDGRVEYYKKSVERGG